MKVGGRLPASASHMIGWSSGLVLLTIGGSIAARQPALRLRDLALHVLQRHVDVALELELDVMLAWPWREVEEISFTPSTEVTASSTMSTTSVSMISGEAPSQVTETLTTGKSTSGFWLTPSPLNTLPKPVKQSSPKPISANIRIQAKTWLRIEMSASVMPVAIWCGSSGTSAGRGASALMARPSSERPRRLRPARPPCRPPAGRSPRRPPPRPPFRPDRISTTPVPVRRPIPTGRRRAVFSCTT